MKTLRFLHGLGFVSLLALGAITLIACGDDDDDASPTAANATTAAPIEGGKTVPASAASPTPTQPGTSGEPQKLDVTAKDFDFDPVKFTLNVSASGGAAGSVNVSFSNTGRANHTFNLYSDKDYKTPVPGAEIKATPGGGSGASVFVAPTKPTTFYFRCEIHNQMQGTIEFR